MTSIEKDKIFIMNHIVSRKGIALLITLWMLVILAVMALSFSLLVRTSSHATLTFKEGVENKFLAEAGIQRGILEIIYRNTNRNQGIITEGKEVLRFDGTPYTDQVGNGHYRIRITNESGKIDLNSLTDMSAIVLNNLLVNLGTAKEEADTIVDSILDWKDADDLHRLNGAESGYYQSLPNPHKAKDAPFETLEELILVKGVTSDLLYGNGKQKGLINYITVYSRLDKPNINYVPKEILMAIPNITEETASEIVSSRQSALDGQSLITSAGQVQHLAAMSQFLSNSDSDIYTIESTGYKRNERTGYTVKAVVALDGNNKCRYLYYRSPVYIQ